MMADVTTDEIIEVCPCITNRMIENLEYFLYSIKEFEEQWLGTDILNSNDLFDCTIDLQQWQKDYLEEVSKNVSRNANCLEIINEETVQLQSSQNNILKDITKNEKEIQTTKKRISNIKKKKENLVNMRDEVQIFKLLTNTSFTYKGSIISGYVYSNKHVESFELDPEKLSKVEITNNLFSLIKKVSSDVKESEQ